MTDEDQFVRNVKADLKRLVESTSPQTRAKLEQIVDAAIGGRVRARRPLRRVAWPLGAVAASAAAVTLALLLWRDEVPPSNAPHAPATAADDAALLLNIDNLDLLERMEFYQWLEQQPGILDGERGAVPGDSSRSPQRS
jgi:hypothetical protein